MRSCTRACRLAFVAPLIACASTPSSSPPTQNDRLVVSGDAGNLRSYEDVPQASATLKSPKRVVVPVLKDAYTELGIPVKVADPISGQVGNTYFIRNYKLGDMPISRYLDCGGTITGPAADNYKITMSVVSVVSVSGSGSKVDTRVSARADDAAGSSGSLSCRTLGTLETQLHRVLVRRLGDREQ